MPTPAHDPFPSITGLSQLIEAEAAAKAVFCDAPAWVAGAYVETYQAAGRAAFAAEPTGTFPANFVAALEPTRYAQAVALHTRRATDDAEAEALAADVAAFVG